LQRLYSDAGNSDNIVTIELHDLPGGEDAFELCAKYCYGITIDISAHNFVSAFCAAKFLRMTESVEKGNFVVKLEAFFMSCILEGWKDSVVALQSTSKLPEWSETYGITRKCIDSIVEKILTPPAKVKNFTAYFLLLILQKMLKILRLFFFLNRGIWDFAPTRFLEHRAKSFLRVLVMGVL
jgi:hypothetical protein